MTEDELWIEASRLGLTAAVDVGQLRHDVTAERHRRWKIENADSIAAWSDWVEKNGLPLEEYRVWPIPNRDDDLATDRR